MRERTRKTTPANGGNECTGPHQETQSCNDDDCPLAAGIAADSTAAGPNSSSANASAMPKAGEANATTGATIVAPSAAAEAKPNNMPMYAAGAVVVIVVAGAAYKYTKGKQKKPAEGGDEGQAYDEYEDDGGY